MTAVLLIGAGLSVTPHLLGLRSAGLDRLELVSTRRAARDRVRAVVPCGEDHSELREAVDAILAIAGGERPFAVVATPPSVHLQHVEALVRDGFDVLVEKPVAHTLEDTLAVAECAQRHGARLFVCLQHRYKESATRARALLDAGALGAVVGATVNVPWHRPQSYYDEPGRGTVDRDGGGVIITQAIHVLDLFSYLMPPVVSVAAATGTIAHRMPTEDLAGGVLAHEGGAVSTLLATTATEPGTAESVSVWGTAGRLRVEGTTLDLTDRDGVEQCLVAPEPISTGPDPAEMAPWYRSMYADVLDARRTGATTRVDIDAVMPTHRVVHALYSAAAAGRWVAPEEGR